MLTIRSGIINDINVCLNFVTHMTDETLALDTIHDVEPGGSFLGSDHTLKHMREISQPDLIKESEKDVITEAYEQVLCLLENHIPDPLPESSKEALQLIIQEYEAEKVTLGMMRYRHLRQNV